MTPAKLLKYWFSISAAFLALLIILPAPMAEFTARWAMTALACGFVLFLLFGTAAYVFFFIISALRN